MINLECENKNEKIIKKYLEANASPELVKKINEGNKTLKGFFKYAKNEAEKSAKDGVACIEDKVVFGWAIHYFEEDSIKEDGTKASAPKVEPKNEAPKKKEEPKAGTEQISLFDL